jgi:hypothetical protein
MSKAFRAAALIAAVSLGTSATSLPARAAELGPIRISVSSGEITISNTSSSWYVYDFNVGNSSPGGASLYASTSQPEWQATVETSLIGSNILTVADYLSLGSLSDDIGPGQTSSAFSYDSNAVANLYNVSLVNSTGDYSNYSVSGAPEPATWAMMLLGFAGLAFAGYRRARIAA